MKGSAVRVRASASLNHAVCRELSGAAAATGIFMTSWTSGWPHARALIQATVGASGRLPHIHLAVFHFAYEELVTRYVVRRGSKAARITVVLTPLL